MQITLIYRKTRWNCYFKRSYECFIFYSQKNIQIISIGEMIAFRDLLFEALNDVMNSRCSFLVSTVDVLVNNAVDEVEKIVNANFIFFSKFYIQNISELCAACGLKIDHMDLALVTAIQRQSQANGFTDPDEHYVCIHVYWTSRIDQQKLTKV